MLKMFPLVRLKKVLPAIGRAMGKEVQSHGFSWEKDILKNVYGASDAELKNIGYTNKIDMPGTLNRLDAVDISVKTTGTPNTVCMGDALRMYDSIASGRKIHVVVIGYEQDDINNLKRVKCITEVDITGRTTELFGTLTREDIKELDSLVKSVPQKRSPTPEEHAKLYELQGRLQPKSGAIYLNIKCNSQQSRLQCSFNQFTGFVKNNPGCVVAQSESCEFRGGCIAREIQSGRRVFKKKAVA